MNIYLKFLVIEVGDLSGQDDISITVYQNDILHNMPPKSRKVNYLCIKLYVNIYSSSPSALFGNIAFGESPSGSHLRFLEILEKSIADRQLTLQRGDRPYTSESDVSRRQVLTAKVDHSIVKVKIFIMAVDP